MHSLPLFHRLEGTKVVVVGEGAEAEAKQRLIERAGGTICNEAEAHLAKLAFVALEDEADALRAARRLKERGLLVNVVDRPHLCEFTTPSICEREPVLIAVGTGGASAGLAKHVRLRIEALLPANLGALAEKLAAMRDGLRARFPDGGERRRALDMALSPGGRLDPLDPASSERADDWLLSQGPRKQETAEQETAEQDAAEQDAAEQDMSNSSEAVSAMKQPQGSTGPNIQTILLSSDDPDDLTIKQARWLGMADRVIHGASVPDAIINRARADAERIALGDNGDRSQEARIADRIAQENNCNAAGLTVILHMG
jgi:uroporphyrin-III C-methyltransferase/precorrin-2 dehydrogenase/sirohydrochlorin ferrochelatase